jgi:hypothetical protein
MKLQVPKGERPAVTVRGWVPPQQRPVIEMLSRTRSVGNGTQHGEDGHPGIFVCLLYSDLEPLRVMVVGLKGKDGQEDDGEGRGRETKTRSCWN